MGNLKGEWSRGTLIVVIATGFLFAGILVSRYFQTNAGSEPINHKKNETVNRALAAGPIPETIVREKERTIEKEWIQEQHKRPMFWRKQDRENHNVPADPAAQQPAPNDQAPAPSTTKESNAEPSGQAQTQPTDPIANKTIYLTFDDGPSPYSDEIIAFLEQYHYKATFFMIDGNIRKYPDAAKLMVQSGETVGLHSVSHNPKFFYASVNSIITELTQNRNTLKEITGIDSYLIRTPYGSVPYMTEEYRNAVNENGYLMWDWNIDSKDWDYKDERYVSSVIDQLNNMANHNGPIVILLHERKETLEHLPQLLEYLTGQGFEGKAIDRSMVALQF